MKYFILVFTLFLFSINLSAQREFEMQDGDTTYVMKSYIMCLYLSGDKAENFDSITLASLQTGHMAHIDSMATAGAVLIAGPFGDNTEKRGVLIFDLATLEEAEVWVKEDPMVKAGRLKYELHPWWAAKGSVLK